MPWQDALKPLHPRQSLSIPFTMKTCAQEILEKKIFFPFYKKNPFYISVFDLLVPYYNS
jgi:hypothetical protein